MDSEAEAPAAREGEPGRSRGARRASARAPHPASPPICHMTTRSHMILIRTATCFRACNVMESMRPQRMKALPFVIYSKFEACYHRSRANAGAAGPRPEPQTETGRCAATDARRFSSPRSARGARAGGCRASSARGGVCAVPCARDGAFRGFGAGTGATGAARPRPRPRPRRRRARPPGRGGGGRGECQRACAASAAIGTRRRRRRRGQRRVRLPLSPRLVQRPPPARANPPAACWPHNNGRHRTGAARALGRALGVTRQWPLSGAGRGRRLRAGPRRGRGRGDAARCEGSERLIYTS